MLDQQPKLSVGQLFGRFEVLCPLGEGGMGEVYLVQDSSLGRKIALKLLPSYLTNDLERVRRFEQEARSASTLNHPNILTIHEIGRVKGRQFIATEYVDGKTLRQELASEGRLPIGEALDIAIQIASALAASHEAGVVHRDIKPENVMIRRDKLVKILDFGLAKLTEKSVTAEDATRLFVRTNPGVVMGTVSYMSPEQARGKDVGASTDIFSLGVVLYEMLAGRLPFAGDTTSDVIAAILTADPAPPTHYNPEIPAELEKIINKMLAKSHADRYGAENLVSDLRQLKKRQEFEAEFNRGYGVTHSEDPQSEFHLSQGLTGNAPTQILDSAIAKSEKPGIRRIWLLSALIGSLVLAGLGYGLWSYWHQRRNIESIAVMPFVNESGNSEIEYLSDGMTESLINSLSQLPNLSVKARSSVFRYKGMPVEPQQVGADLSVQAILTGRVVQRGEDLALYLSLVDASNGNQLWGEQYDRRLKDLVALQSEITRDVSQKLRARLSGAEAQLVAKNYTENATAYQLYLKGRYHILRLTPSETQKGISYLKQAIEIDPAYALAYVGLANGYRSMALSGDTASSEVFPKSKAAAQKAVEIDETLAEAHAVLGFTISWYDWDWNAAEKQFQRALALNPNSADAHWVYAGSISNLRRHAEALAEIKRARELDPLNLIINASEGLILIHAGQPDEGLAVLQKTSELDQSYWLAHLFASSAYIDKGMFAEAVAEARKARELSGISSQPVSYACYALAKSGKKAEARVMLEELLNLSRQRYVPPYHIAFAYHGLDDREETLRWLQKGFEQRDPKMVFLNADPKWNSLRVDPRFQDLLRRMDFPL